MNRPFVFRLERVRRVRERAEELAQQELASSLQSHRHGEAALGAASSRLDDARRTHPLRARESGVAGADLRAAQAYLERLAAQRRHAAQELDDRSAEVQARRDALREAARELEVLERLRERRRGEHTRNSERLSAVALDEVALVAHARKASR
ncbi:MAG: flagellar export protein FliJ [Actinobacteria bacterium]|nr:flagellar export protein FliJ [Actinomycetota bacterium]